MSTKDTGKSRSSRIMAAPLLLPSKSPFSDGIDEFQILLAIFLQVNVNDLFVL